MTLKEKLTLMTDIRKANEQRLHAWIEERKKCHERQDQDQRRDA